MIRGTTPHFTVTLPFDTSLIDSLRVNFAQQNDDNVIVSKTEADCEMNGNEITLSLTQEETYLFSPVTQARVQLHIFTTAGESLKSGIFPVDVGRSLGDEVLS